jgi:hypothetical protein
VVPLAEAPTPFATLGHWLTLFWAMVFLGLSGVALRRSAR